MTGGSAPYAGMPCDESVIIHASCVAIDGRAVLLQGQSGAGKSDLALRLIDRGASLVSDDYTRVSRHGATLFAAPEPAIAGMIEIRNIGIVTMAYCRDVPVALALALDDKPERMPDRSQMLIVAGASVPLLALDAAQPSAALKVEWALRTLAGPHD